MTITSGDIVHRVDHPGTYRVLNTRGGLALIQLADSKNGTRVVPISRLAQVAAVPTT
ncbi:hypothetical protein [Nocardia ignorata]|uniref:Uncharacterized protein n=1 Tax=Nocardia ignorata TaxID=145285 RepID=A0A4R6NYC6_NOCIG|nr:hypothetical protein [Nocardia ignorata]TDP29776.1 hypothetical protein DFR75_11240 [Nocardia ignorata]